MLAPPRYLGAWSSSLESLLEHASHWQYRSVIWGHTCSACGSLQWLQWVGCRGARSCSGHTEEGGGGEEYHSMHCQVPLTKERGWTNSVSERGQRGIKTCAAMEECGTKPKCMILPLTWPTSCLNHWDWGSSSWEEVRLPLERRLYCWRSHFFSLHVMCADSESGKTQLMSWLLLHVSLAGLLACL